MFATGRLIVRPQTAQLTHNRDFLNKMDPYCVVSLGGQTFNTTVARGQGRTPGWSDALTFNINNDQVLIVRLFDKDRLTRDDFIGECSVPLADVYQRGSLSNWFNVFNQGRLEGSILITLEFLPSNMGFSQGFMPQQVPMHTTINNTYLPPVQQSICPPVQQTYISSPPMLSKSYEFIQPNSFSQTTTTYRQELLAPEFIGSTFGRF